MATKTSTTFSLGYRIEREIQAPAARIWALLTNAAKFPSWNSTVTSIEGEIALGNKLGIKVPLDPKRTFHPKVIELIENERTRWADGFAPMFRGVRTFTLAPSGQGATKFVMEERFSGLMLPMIKGSLPDFGPAFDRYAEDLARAAEK